MTRTKTRSRMITAALVVGVGPTNTDAAHEAGESPARAAAEATDDAQVATTPTSAPAAS